MAETSTKIDFQVIEDILKKFDYKKSYLIAMLQSVQAVYKYLPEEAMTYIGEHVDGLSPATVYGVATFYAQFSLEPKGKYEIRVCDGTACHVRGSMPVLNAIKNKCFASIFFTFLINYGSHIHPSNSVSHPNETEFNQQ